MVRDLWSPAVQGEPSHKLRSSGDNCLGVVRGLSPSSHGLSWAPRSPNHRWEEMGELGCCKHKAPPQRKHLWLEGPHLSTIGFRFLRVPVPCSPSSWVAGRLPAWAVAPDLPLPLPARFDAGPLPLTGTPSPGALVKGRRLRRGSGAASLTGRGLFPRPCLPTPGPVLYFRPWYRPGGQGPGDPAAVAPASPRSVPFPQTRDALGLFPEWVSPPVPHL